MEIDDDEEQEEEVKPKKGKGNGAEIGKRGDAWSRYISLVWLVLIFYNNE